MTSTQLVSLNTNLIPTSTSTSISSLTTQQINKFFIFFYKIKINYDRYQQGLSVCPKY